jgi:hypothetical protein
MNTWEHGTTQRPDEEGLQYPSSLRFDPSNEEYNNTLQGGEAANLLVATAVWYAFEDWFQVLDPEPLLDTKSLLFPVRYSLAKNDTPIIDTFMASLTLMKHKDTCQLESQRRLILDPKHIADWTINEDNYVQVAGVFDALNLQASFFSEGDCCQYEEAWSRANRCVKDLFDMLLAIASSLRMKILAKMVTSSDLPEELFDQLSKSTPDQETLAVVPASPTSHHCLKQIC